MRAMTRASRGIRPFLAVATALLALGSCKGMKQKLAPPPVAQLDLKPAAAARADLASEIVFPSFERSLASVGAVAKKLGLPFGNEDLKRMLIAKGGMAPAVFDRLDLSKPASIALVLTRKKGETAETIEPALAFQTRTAIAPGGLPAFAAGFGQVVETSKDAVRVKAGDAGGPEVAGKDLWLVARDGAVCGSATLEVLAAGCGVAFESRKSGDQDLRVALYPEGIARANGTTLKDALAKARQEMAAQQARSQAALPGADPKLQASANKMAEGMVNWVFDAVADTALAHIGLSIDPTKGLSTTFDVVPRPSTGLARAIASRHAYELHPAVATGAPGMLWTQGDMSLSRAMFQSMRGPLLETIASEADRAKAGASMDTLFDALSGPFSARFSFEEGSKLSLVYDIVYTLKPGTDGKKVMADLESMLKAPWLAHFFDLAFQGTIKVKLTAKREGDVLVTQVVADTKKMPKDARAQLKGLPLFDGTPLETRTALAGDKLVMAIGPGAKARLTGLLSGTAGAPPSGELATALAESKGEDGLYYLDLGAVMRPFINLAASGAIGAKGSPEAMQASMMARGVGGMLANARLAMWGSYHGGQTAVLTGRIPMSTFESVAVVVRGVMGGH
jgi:hypothetical protein